MTDEESREQALTALYSADVQDAAQIDTSGLSPKARWLASGVWEHREELDVAIADYAKGWRVERMPAIDRNVLRIGAFELAHSATPVAVVIDEAVELAKRFSTTKSGSFVNGVLDAMKATRAPDDSIETDQQSS